MKKKSVLIFQKLHPLNLPLASICSLFITIAYWRTERLAQHWLGRFKVMDPGEHFTLDEWQKLIEEAFKSFKKTFNPDKEQLAMRRLIAGVDMDFSNNWRQWLAINYEERFLFLSLIARWLKADEGNGQCYLAAMMFDRCAKACGFVFPSSPAVKYVRIFRWVDEVWQWIIAMGQAIRQLILLLRGGIPGKHPNVRYLWTGISAAEIPEGEKKLNFAFLTERGLIEAGECLYFLPHLPSHQARKKLDDQNIHWTPVSSYGFLPFWVRLRAVLSLAGFTFREFTRWRESFKSPFALQFSSQGTPWVYIARTLRPAAYLTSVSACWPESPEVAIMNALGVRTINWSYGANTFCYAEQDSGFQDLGLARSMPVAKEVWVWSEEVREWLEARALSSGQTIRFTGPVMCGDCRWLHKSPAEARADYGIQAEERIFISVFDVPPISRHIRLQVGHGPSMYPLEMLDNFYDDIRALVERFPGVTLIMKPKRALDDPRRQYPEGMNVLLDPQGPYISQGRLVLLEHDIDPYIPVAMADICLGVPFTSPVMVSLNAGREGIYHDPLGKVNHFRPSVMAKFVTHGRNELLERVKQLQNTNQHWRAELNEDPGENFVRMLKNE